MYITLTKMFILNVLNSAQCEARKRVCFLGIFAEIINERNIEVVIVQQSNHLIELDVYYVISRLSITLENNRSDENGM